MTLPPPYCTNLDLEATHGKSPAQMRTLLPLMIAPSDYARCLSASQPASDVFPSRSDTDLADLQSGITS